MPLTRPRRARAAHPPPEPRAPAPASRGLRCAILIRVQSLAADLHLLAEVTKHTAGQAFTRNEVARLQGSILGVCGVLNCLGVELDVDATDEEIRAALSDLQGEWSDEDESPAEPLVSGPRKSR